MLGVNVRGPSFLRLFRAFGRRDGLARHGRVIRPRDGAHRGIHGHDGQTEGILSVPTWSGLLVQVCKRDRNTPKPAGNASFPTRFALFHYVRQQSDELAPQVRAARRFSCARRARFPPEGSVTQRFDRSQESLARPLPLFSPSKDMRKRGQWRGEAVQMERMLPLWDERGCRILP